MANVDNSCSKLKIENSYDSSTSHLKDILDLQADTQKNVYGWKFENMTLKELMYFWHINNHAIIDEIHEATDALGGINDGIGNAVWKPWKKDHSKTPDMKISDLSEDDLLELKFEIVDILHFFMNMAASIGMSAEEMYNMYMSKNQENRERQKNGY
jgi:hypothetical protein